MYREQSEIYTDYKCLKYFFTQKELNMKHEIKAMVGVNEIYECEILYHPGKINVVADALSRKSFGSVLALKKLLRPLKKEMCRAKIEIITGGLIAMTIQCANSYLLK